MRPALSDTAAKDLGKSTGQVTENVETPGPGHRPIGVNLAAGISAPLQGLAYNLIPETQAVGLGCDRAPLWGLKAPLPGENRRGW